MRKAVLGFVVSLTVMSACSGSGSSPPDAAASADVCGDGVCNATEIGSCTLDCGGTVGATCGNAICEAGETSATCPGDCPAGQQCGDGTCTPPENASNCPGDCGTTGGAVCGNLACEPGETEVSCPSDCSILGGTCPNGDILGCIDCWLDPSVCVPPQTEQICEACLFGTGGGGACNFDFFCDPGEDPLNCPTDCP
ncbi:MAG: hypothetical protein KIT31_16075 [Deltaproteobacteria bacterium]|nr:hypothetical protein [Deltaproteobacteria bacterium]